MADRLAVARMAHTQAMLALQEVGARLGPESPPRPKRTTSGVPAVAPTMATDDGGSGDLMDTPAGAAAAADNDDDDDQAPTPGNNDNNTRQSLGYAGFCGATQAEPGDDDDADDRERHHEAATVDQQPDGEDAAGDAAEGEVPVQEPPSSEIRGYGRALRLGAPLGDAYRRRRRGELGRVGNADAA